MDVSANGNSNFLIFYLNKNLFFKGHSVLQGKLINLDTLDLLECSLSNQGWIEMLVICGTKLKALNLAGNHNLTGEGLSVFKDKLVNLETLGRKFSHQSRIDRVAEDLWN